MSEVVSISLAADHRYLPGLQATMASMILSASRKDLLRFSIFADGLSDADCSLVLNLAQRLGVGDDAVVFHHPDMTGIKKLFQPYNGSYAAFLRLYLCEFLDEEWTIYADVDTLWFRDPCELWKERDRAVSLLWCKDLPSIAQGVKEYARPYCPNLDVNRYACSGVVLMNLARMRQNNLVSKCAEFVSRWGTPPFVDQDILNVVCHDDSKLLDQCWDCMMPDRAAVKGVVLHFNGIGRMFNGPMTGFRALYYAWYRFYYDIVEKATRRKVCSLPKRILFWFTGMCFPSRSLIQCIFFWADDMFIDSMTRSLFFAWLFRHAEWWRKWMRQV